MRVQRVRIVCISDTHNQTPHLPPGDVLIHAGDLTQRGTTSELERLFHWLNNANFKVKIVVAGNHDRGLDKQYQPHGRAAQTQQQVQSNIDLYNSAPDIHYLQHESKVIKLPNDDGTEVRLKVFGSPFSPNRREGAFSYPPSDGVRMWQSIPLDADVVVTHTPAKYHLDESTRHGSVGCEELRHVLWRVRPKLFVSGHIHEARGAEVVEWDLETPQVQFKEKSAQGIEDTRPSSSKQFNIDLTSRGESQLRNDGSRGDLLSPLLGSGMKGARLKDRRRVPDRDRDCTIGRGGADAHAAADHEALAGRRGRLQTCIVNAALLTRSEPHDGSGGKRVNKTIVIDLDLPVNEDEDA